MRSATESALVDTGLIKVLIVVGSVVDGDLSGLSLTFIEGDISEMTFKSSGKSGISTLSESNCNSVGDWVVESFCWLSMGSSEDTSKMTFS